MVGGDIRLAGVGWGVVVQSLSRSGVDLVDDEDNTHVDHGLTGTKRVRPGLREAISGRVGDTLVVAKLGRLAPRFPA